MNRNHIIVSFLPLFLMCTSCQKTENVASSSSSESYEDHRTVDYFGDCSFHAHSFSDFQTLYQDFKNHNTLPILAFDFSSGEKIWETTYTLAGLGDRRLPLSEVELSGKVNFSFKAEWDDPENYFGGIFFSYRLENAILFEEPFSKENISVESYPRNNEGDIYYRDKKLFTFRLGLGGESTAEEREDFLAGLKDKIVYME